MDLKFSK